MKAVLERNLGFVGYPEYSVDTDGNGDFVKEWKSCTDVDRVLGYDKAAINRCCHGKQTTSYGYMWRYKKEDD